MQTYTLDSLIRINKWESITNMLSIAVFDDFKPLENKYEFVIAITPRNYDRTIIRISSIIRFDREKISYIKLKDLPILDGLKCEHSKLKKSDGAYFIENRLKLKVLKECIETLESLWKNAIEIDCVCCLAVVTLENSQLDQWGTGYICNKCNSEENA